MLSIKKTNKPLRAYTLTEFILAYGLICIFYRASIGIEGAASNNLAGIANFAVLALGFFEDLIVGFVIFTPFYFIKNGFFRNFILSLLLIFTAINYLINKKLFLMLAIHFAYSSILTSLDNGFTLNYFLPFLNIYDWAMIFSPLAILIFLKIANTKWIDSFIFYFVVLSITGSLTFGLLVFSWYSIPLTAATTVGFYSNPLRFMTTDFYYSLNNQYAHVKNFPSSAQMQSISFIDPVFINKKNKSSPPTMSGAPVKWNIVMVVLESVGSQYVFDASHYAMPMPFLHSLAKQGLWLSNLYSAGNNSPIGAFGLFSSLYPSPLPTHAMMRPDIMIPNMAAWLGNNYDSFFITPADTRIYFPKRFMINTGFKQFYDANTLPLKNKKLLYHMYLNDLTVLDFFLSRVGRAQQPFFAVYWPCATHHPYVPYDNQKPLLRDIEHPISRYINNLNVMDYQLREIMAFLKKKHLSDNTIFIVVGDHGESFGQHAGEGTWLHGGAVFQEQIQVPALFYQPRLFKPQELAQPTSTVDLLPTLLDAMKIPYDVNRFQGESLLRTNQNRKYIFVYGENNALVAIDQQNIKTQISFNQGQCLRFDLVKDPKEQHPLICLPEAEDAIIKFRNYQPALFEAYNRSLLLNQV